MRTIGMNWVQKIPGMGRDTLPYAGGTPESWFDTTSPNGEIALVR